MSISLDSNRYNTELSINDVQNDDHHSLKVADEKVNNLIANATSIKRKIQDDRLAAEAMKPGEKKEAQLIQIIDFAFQKIKEYETLEDYSIDKDLLTTETVEALESLIDEALLAAESMSFGIERDAQLIKIFNFLLETAQIDEAQWAAERISLGEQRDAQLTKLITVTLDRNEAEDALCAAKAMSIRDLRNKQLIRIIDFSIEGGSNIAFFAVGQLTQGEIRDTQNNRLNLVKNRVSTSCPRTRD
ncbi:MAG: hypothetical protein AAF443_06300 [Chlamydiota bacterium]